MPKFVSDKQPRHHAERLGKLQAEIAKKRAELRILEKEAGQLERYLLTVNRGKSFEYDGALYRKVCLITHPTRMILDQDEVKRMLKSRTPYKTAESTLVKIDYVYEKE